MKIIVTGALGHIGSYLIRDLALQFPRSHIVMIDNMMTQRFSSLFNLPTLASYQFIEGDVTKIDLMPLLKNADVVVHLAAITDAAGSFDNAEALERSNYNATVNVAEACVLTGTRLVALSSTSVYSTKRDVVEEDCAPDELRPQSPYAITKLKEERFLSRLVREEGLGAVSCRFGTIFGPSNGMRFHTAVNRFCWQAVMKQPITVWSTAYDQKRPYLDLFDAARAIAFIIREDLFHGDVYNVLTHNLSVSQVVEVIREFVPDLNITFIDNKIMNQLSYDVSNDKFVCAGFNFSGDIKRGVAQTIGYLRNSNS